MGNDQLPADRARSDHRVRTYLKVTHKSFSCICRHIVREFVSVVLKNVLLQVFIEKKKKINR